MADYFVVDVHLHCVRSAEAGRLAMGLTPSYTTYSGTIDDALRASGEGFAGQGLFFGGRRLRAEGRIGVEGEERIGDFLRGQELKEEESRLRQQRLGEDIDLRRQTFERRLGAERETATLGDIAKQREEAQRRRLIEASQFAGGPFASAPSTIQKQRFLENLTFSYP